MDIIIFVIVTRLPLLAPIRTTPCSTSSHIRALWVRVSQEQWVQPRQRCTRPRSKRCCHKLASTTKWLQLIHWCSPAPSTAAWMSRLHFDTCSPAWSWQRTSSRNRNTSVGMSSSTWRSKHRINWSHQAHTCCDWAAWGSCQSTHWDSRSPLQPPGG